MSSKIDCNSAPKMGINIVMYTDTHICTHSAISQCFAMLMRHNDVDMLNRLTDTHMHLHMVRQSCTCTPSPATPMLLETP